MRALTVTPGRPGTARLEVRDEPVPEAGDVLVEAVAVGVCGTDREIADGHHGSPPAGESRLVLGHESLGRVISGGGAELPPGTHVAAMVREADPVPCPACASGEVDMCSNGRYREHGIRELDGFAAERWAVPTERLVRIPAELGMTGVLAEPASVVAKAWERIDLLTRHSGGRRVLVTGAGPIGMLAALMGVQRGLDVDVLDVVTDGPKPELVRDLGASYLRGDPTAASATCDIVVECTGVGRVVAAVLGATAPNAVICLTGLTSGGRTIPVDMGRLGRELVLENDVVLGSVSANRRHFERAVTVLSAARPSWLRRLITRRVPLARWPEALTLGPHDVKVILDLQTGGDPLVAAP